MSPAGVRVAVLLARESVTAPCLTVLAQWAEERGPEWTAVQVAEDPGLTFVPNGEGRHFYMTAEEADFQQRHSHICAKCLRDFDCCEHKPSWWEFDKGPDCPILCRRCDDVEDRREEP